MLLSPRVTVTPFTATRFVCSALASLIGLFLTKLVAKIPSSFLFFCLLSVLLLWCLLLMRVSFNLFLISERVSSPVLLFLGLLLLRLPPFPSSTWRHHRYLAGK